MDLLSLFSKLKGGEDKNSDSNLLINPEYRRNVFRTDDQRMAAFYFSDENVKPVENPLKMGGCGCFGKKEVPLPIKVETKPYFNDTGNLGCGCFPKTTKHYMSDEEYDALVKKILSDENVKQKALEALCLDESQVSEVEPINFGAPFSGEGCKFKFGDDEYIRTSMFEKTWIFFSQTALYAYQYILNTDKEDREERLYEFAYKDITSISEVNTKKDIVDANGQRFSYENHLRITVANNELSIRFRPDEDAANSIKAMKTLIREKKN